MSASDYFEEIIVRWACRNTAPPTAPTALFVAAWTVVPNEDGTGGTEVTGGGYARVSVTTGTAGTGVGSGWSDPGTGVSTNVADITFPTASASWGTIVALTRMDASTGGNIIDIASPPGGPVAVGSGATFKVLAGQYGMTVT